jgi:hypothetical protein
MRAHFQFQDVKSCHFSCRRCFRSRAHHWNLPRRSHMANSQPFSCGEHCRHDFSGKGVGIARLGERRSVGRRLAVRPSTSLGAVRSPPSSPVLRTPRGSISSNLVTVAGGLTRAEGRNVGARSQGVEVGNGHLSGLCRLTRHAPVGAGYDRLHRGTHVHGIG